VAKTVNRLTDRSVKSIKDPGLHADGDGLYLVVERSGSKRWAFVFQFNQRRKEMGLGSTATVGLADARAEAAKARKLVHEGTNPIEARKAAKAAAEGSQVTWGELADQVIEDRKGAWTNDRSEAQWKQTLTEYVDFRNKPVPDVTSADVVRCLKKIWLKIPTTARRVRSRVETVFDVAKAAGYYEGENPARWKGHLKLLLPVQPEDDEEHHEALPYDDAPAFYARVAGASRLRSVVALQLTLLTVLRTNEVLGAQRKEFDFEERIWVVPAERMKNRAEFEVPLVDSAIQLLEAYLPADADPDDFIFPGNKGKERVCSSVMEHLLKRWKVKDTTVHGLRSTFSDWAHDETEFQEHIIEQCLDHVVGNKVKRAYRRSTAFKKRRQLMEAWEAYLLGSGAGSGQADELLTRDDG
jgi:integrase